MVAIRAVIRMSIKATGRINIPTKNIKVKIANSNSTTESYDGCDNSYE
jgi:hypothetical protein